ncbi:hypothetical protein CCACVL1_27389, partial [Corchorus capsularis]
PMFCALNVPQSNKTTKEINM